MVVCGKVAIFTVSLASPPNGKVGGVLLRTVLHRHHSERFFECYPCLPSRAACMLHDKQILLKNEVLSMKSNLRNEIKSYIVRSGYTMQESLTGFLRITAGATAFPICPTSSSESLCGMWRQYSLPMPLAMISYGRNGGTHDARRSYPSYLPPPSKNPQIWRWMAEWICKICSACERQN